MHILLPKKSWTNCSAHLHTLRTLNGHICRLYDFLRQKILDPTAMKILTEQLTTLYAFFMAQNSSRAAIHTKWPRTHTIYLTFTAEYPGPTGVHTIILHVYTTGCNFHHGPKSWTDCGAHYEKVWPGRTSENQPNQKPLHEMSDLLTQVPPDPNIYS